MTACDWRVYVMTDHDGLTKIGASHNPEQRRAALGMRRVHYVTPSIEKAFIVERIAQDKLRERGLWSHGEMFTCDPHVAIAAVKAAISDVANGYVAKPIRPRRKRPRTSAVKDSGIRITREIRMAIDARAAAEGKTIAELIIPILERELLRKRQPKRTRRGDAVSPR